jgi:hypothetical protein
MFTASGHPEDWFGLERNFKSIGAEDFLHNAADQDFIIRSLERGRKTPINFQLFIDVGHIAIFIELAADTAHFLMPHFRVKTIEIQGLDGLFQGSPNIAARTLPILFLHDLGRGKIRC